MRQLRLGLLLLCVGFALPAAAQEFVALRASGCGQFVALGGGGAGLQLTLAATVPAGRHIVASIAVANTGLAGNLVQDSNGTLYAASGFTVQNGLIVGTFIGYLNAPLAAGGFVRAKADSGVGSAACLHASEFSGIIPTSFANWGSGVNASGVPGTSQSATLDSPLANARAQLIGATASPSDPGLVTPSDGGALIVRTCRSPTADICLASTHRLAPIPGPAYSISTTTQNSVTWTSSISAFLALPIFEDGFE
jgi:hypothetical protein